MSENKKFYATILLFLAIIFALSYFVIQSGQQDAYTMLYFSNPLEPLIYNASENSIAVNFTVENYENQKLLYIYKVSAFYKNKSRDVEGKIILGDNETAAISEKIILEKFNGNIKIYVKLYREGMAGTYRQIWHEIAV
jgi:hypothetical protein